jgi:hypothetical protein
MLRALSDSIWCAAIATSGRHRPICHPRIHRASGHTGAISGTPTTTIMSDSGKPERATHEALCFETPDLTA